MTINDYVHCSTELSRKRADSLRIPAKIAMIKIITWQRDCERTKHSILFFKLIILWGLQQTSKEIHSISRNSRRAKTQNYIIYRDPGNSRPHMNSTGNDGSCITICNSIRDEVLGKTYSNKFFQFEHLFSS